ncbi:tetratricopeptide repeat protein [Stigmatella hybrida]|uniref:tetratricopeptide repeat protein n=1 Tax=Stigmatella hybrida TaxID=394097 RepID=UPI001CDAE736|nr:tetratricopeptide repeat protein [Stigmatella hybrida]
MRSLLLMTLLSVSDPRLDSGEKLLAARDCEGLQALFASPDSPATGSRVPSARLLVRGASACRKQDTVLAFALTERALALAPEDAGVRTAHAESLLSVEERTDAARLLDAILREHPKDAARARILRAQLAGQESENALAVQLASSLAHHPEYGEQARALLARHQSALQSDAEAREALAHEERALAERAEEAAQTPSHAPRPGSEAWSTRGTLKSGGQRTFRTRNIQAGFTYILHATGTCTPPARQGRKSKLAPPVDLFGQDFRVRIGAQEPLHLKVGLEPERNALTFRAPEDNPQLFLEDRTGARSGGPHCTISDVAVRVP